MSSYDSFVNDVMECRARCESGSRSFRNMRVAMKNGEIKVQMEGGFSLHSVSLEDSEKVARRRFREIATSEILVFQIGLRLLYHESSSFYQCY